MRYYYVDNGNFPESGISGNVVSVNEVPKTNTKTNTKFTNIEIGLQSNVTIAAKVNTEEGRLLRRCQLDNHIGESWTFFFLDSTDGNTTSRIFYCLPTWIGKFIQSSANPSNNPVDGVAYTKNMEKKAWKSYYNNDFPTSFLFADTLVRDYLKYYQAAFKKNEIYILDIGCGTGAATAGAINAIVSNESLKGKKINIVGLDCNNDALELYKALFDVYNKYAKSLNIPEVSMQTSNISFNVSEENTFSALLENECVKNKKFDFVLCFKMINEFYNIRNTSHPEYYKDLCNVVLSSEGILNQSGIFALVDVFMHDCDEKKNLQFYAYLNNQVNTFLKENSSYKCLFPIPCSQFGCMKDVDCSKCRIKKNIYYHRNTPLTYKVIAHNEVVKSIEFILNDTVCTVYDRLPGDVSSYGPSTDFCIGWYDKTIAPICIGADSIDGM